MHLPFGRKREPIMKMDGRIPLRVMGDRYCGEIFVSPDDTLRSVLENAGINSSIGITYLDGMRLESGDRDRTFAQMGIRGDSDQKSYLVNVAGVGIARCPNCKMMFQFRKDEVRIVRTSQSCRPGSATFQVTKCPCCGLLFDRGFVLKGEEWFNEETQT